MELAIPCPSNDLQSMSPVMSHSQDELEFLELNWDEKGLLGHPSCCTWAVYKEINTNHISFYILPSLLTTARPTV